MADFSASSYSVMGDKDQAEFTFNEDLSDSELMELFERNPRVAMQCDWMVQIALENGFSLPPGSEDHLELIHFMEKLKRAISFSKLQGSAMCRYFGSIDTTTEDDDGAIVETNTRNFEVYHRLSGNIGWFIKSSDIGEDGLPKSFHLTMKIEKGRSKTIIVPAEETLIFKNPKKRERWDGTPDSKLIAHTALLEELLLKLTGKHALDIAGAFLLFKNVQSDEHAGALHDAVAAKPLNELYVGGGVEVEPMNNEVKGAISELKVFSDMLKDFMACAMRVSRQSMDGAAEGTLSSAEYNTIMTSSTIKAIQTHFTPYIQDLLAGLGYPNHKLKWNEPIEKLPKSGQQTTKRTDSADATQGV